MSEDEYKSVKIRKEVYEELKKKGVSISEAIKILLEKEKERFEEKMLNIEKSARELIPYLVKAGLFNVKVEGIFLNGYSEEGSNLIINGKIVLRIPDVEVRERFKQFLEGLKVAW